MEKEVKRLQERINRLESELANAERLRAEQDMQLSHYREALETGRDGIALYDADYRLIFCNQNYKNLFKGVATFLTPGRSIDEVARAIAAANLIPEIADDPEAWIKSRSDPALRKIDELYYTQYADGTWIRGCDFRTKEGGFLAVRTDVTDLKEREAELKATTNETLNILEVFFDNSPVPMIVKDTERRYRLVNTAFEKMHGVPAEKVLGQQMETALPNMAAALGPSADYAVLQGIGSVSREHQVYRPDGHEGTVTTTKFPIRDAQGNISAIGAISIDITRFIDMQEKLTAKSELLETTLRSIDQGFAVFDKDLQIIACNQRFFELHDYPGKLPDLPDRMDLRDILQMFAERGAYGTKDPLGEVERRFKLLADPNRPVREERRQPDGRILDVRRTSLPEGGYVATYTDITDLKQAEESARNAHTLLREILDTLHSAVCLYDSKRRLIYCNKATRTLFEWQMELHQPGVTIEAQLRDALAKDMVCGIDRPEEEWLQQRIRRFDEKANDVLTERPDDHWIVSHFRATSDGGTVAVHRDITDRKRAERALRESEENFRNLVEHTEIGISITQRRHILFANDAFARIFGYDDPVDVMRKGHYDRFVAPRDLERVQAISDARSAGLPAPNVYEFEGIRKDGTTLWLQRTSRRVNWNGMRVTLGTVIDVTQRRLAEERLRTALDAAETANRTKSDFLAKMSHELRTPLNAIIGFSEVLGRETFGPLGNPRYNSYVDDIAVSGRHLLEMINDILDMSKIESGSYEIAPSVCDLLPVISETVQVVRGQMEQRQIDFRITIAPDTPELFADRRAIRQILLNLLSNAIKFTPEGGKISITAGRRPEDGLVITVADTGIGIAEGDLDAVLQPFNQGHNPHSAVQEGTGLGLPIVKSLVELHGGTLTLTSAPGTGTTVTIFLPGRAGVAGANARAG